MRRTLATVIATGAILLSGLAHAEVYHQGRVYQTTADRIIVDQRLKCTYGPWSFEQAPNGATILTRAKVCKS